jgi:hypothetical protein
LRDLADRAGWHVAEEVTESRSAKEPGTRPGFERVLKMIEAGKADAILVWSINRLTRNPVDAGRLSWLLQNGVLQAIRTPEKEYLPTDNVLILSVETGTANQFILDLRKAVVRGMKSKAERGEFPHRAPEGYRNDPYTRTVVPDPERFPLLQRAWRLLVAGTHTPAEVVRLLNGEWGYRTRPTRKRPGGSPLATSSAYQIFSNVFYTGRFRHAGVVYNGAHPPMVSPDEFARVQERCFGTGGEGNCARHRRSRHGFAFTGLITCARCGRLATAEVQTGRSGQGRYVYYHCNNRSGACGKRSIREDVLEREIDACLTHITVAPEFTDVVMDLLERWIHEELGSLEAVGLEQQHAAAEADRMLEELVDLRLRRLISDEQFATKQGKLFERADGLRRAAGGTNERLARLRATVRSSLEFRVRARDEFLTGDADTRRAVTRALGLRYTLEDGKVTVALNPLLTPMQPIRTGGAEQHPGSVRPESPTKQTVLARIEPSNVGSWSTKKARSDEPVCAGTEERMKNPPLPWWNEWYALFQQVMDEQLLFAGMSDTAS